MGAPLSRERLEKDLEALREEALRMLKDKMGRLEEAYRRALEETEREYKEAAASFAEKLS